MRVRDHKVAPIHRHALEVFARTCQVAAGVLLPEAAPTAVIAAAHEVFSAVPPHWTAHAADVVPAILTAFAFNVQRCATGRQDLPARGRAEAAAVERALDVLLGDYGPDMTLTVLAERAGVSRAYLCSELRRSTGRGLFDHLHALRVLDFIRRLGEATAIQRAAASCGYRHAREVNRSFMRLVGTSPSRFRRNTVHSCAGSYGPRTKPQ